MTEVVQEDVTNKEDAGASSGISDKTDQGGTSRSCDTASPEALTDSDDRIQQLSKVMFEKIADYLQGELAGTLEDYKLLEEMNRATTVKYSDMKQIAANVSKALKELNEKYKSLQPYLEQIEQIEESALKLEQAAYKLDAYSKRLEAKFKALEKR